ncbi:uncharacterized protein LOC120404397 isoform X2 [Mauremys reevesii]|uniref:uncharacterized protein LOC120404397 isoform X2 n=1 Tax=Mauremys reevesii TaxID=260615 RepID=UPI00193F9DBA|nr:uncharacterized protein LOC120404397 isoform X2 [Mauremys reevesii]
MSMTGLQRELHGQWLNMPLYHGIVDLFFPLAAEASLGKYTINMPGLKNTFSVEEYGTRMGSQSRAKCRPWCATSQYAIVEVSSKQTRIFVGNILAR